MKIYTHILFLLIILMSTQSVFAQTKIDSIKISPSNPIKKDTVKVHLYTHTSQVSTRIYLSTQLINNDFLIETCYDIQGSPASTYYSDTLTMGELLDGTYRIIVSCHRSLGTQCDYLDTTKDTLTFTILPPVSVTYIEVGSVDVRPNPANDILHINTSASVHIKEASIYNTCGVLLGKHKGSKPIDISSYPSGVYLIRLNTDKGPYTQKFVKQ